MGVKRSDTRVDNLPICYHSSENRLHLKKNYNLETQLG
jgi:hypothetical protein